MTSPNMPEPGEKVEVTGRHSVRLRMFPQVGFRCSKEQKRALRLRACTAVREAATERATARWLDSLILDARQAARKDKRRPKAVRAILQEEGR